MANSSSENSRAKRQETANARRKRIKEDGGKDLSGVLLDANYVRKLKFLSAWFGTPDEPAAQTDTIKRLIDTTYKQLAYKAVFADQLPMEAETKEALAEEAYAEGYVACSQNKPISANLYSDEPLAEEWRKGWRHYDADYNPDYYSSPLADDL